MRDITLARNYISHALMFMACLKMEDKVSSILIT